MQGPIILTIVFQRVWLTFLMILIHIFEMALSSFINHSDLSCLLSPPLSSLRPSFLPYFLSPPLCSLRPSPSFLSYFLSPPLCSLRPSPSFLPYFLSPPLCSLRPSPSFLPCCLSCLSPPFSSLRPSPSFLPCCLSPPLSSLRPSPQFLPSWFSCLLSPPLLSSPSSLRPSPSSALISSLRTSFAMISLTASSISSRETPRSSRLLSLRPSERCPPYSRLRPLRAECSPSKWMRMALVRPRSRSSEKITTSALFIFIYKIDQTPHYQRFVRRFSWLKIKLSFHTLPAHHKGHLLNEYAYHDLSTMIFSNANFICCMAWKVVQQLIELHIVCLMKARGFILYLLQDRLNFCTLFQFW